MDKILFIENSKKCMLTIDVSILLKDYVDLFFFP